MNISTRGRVGVDDDILIAGFVVEGDGLVNVLVRVVGPSLNAPSLNVLEDPEIIVLEIAPARF